MVAHGVEDLLLGYRIGHSARETTPAMAVIARMKFAAKKNSTCLVAYVIS